MRLNKCLIKNDDIRSTKTFLNALRHKNRVKLTILKIDEQINKQSKQKMILCVKRYACLTIST